MWFDIKGKLITQTDLMASNILLLSILISKLLVFTDAQSVAGVCYGQHGNGLPSKQDVVSLYQKNGINRMRMYGPNPAALQALGGTNIELILDVPNDSLEALTDPNAAAGWVQDNILKYPNVKFRYISVGNEVDPDTGSGRFLNFVLPAMKNVQKAIQDAGLQIKVSTATYTGLLKTSSPPSDGAFKDNVVGYIQPIISFLAENNSTMLANIYPYFAYLGPPKLDDLSYALFTKPDNGQQYKNLFDAMFDAHYAAQSRLGGADVPIVVSESGWPSAGDDGATMENAGTYYKNLIAHLKSGQGTPSRPGISIETYLFAMFDEDLKEGNIKKRKSHQPDTFGWEYYACPLSKPREKDHRCGYFMWKSEFDEQLRVTSSALTSHGSGSAPTGCSNCNEKDLRINMLEAQKQVLETRVRMLEARLEMATNPDDPDHTCRSAAILCELLGDKDNLHM